MMLSRLIFIVGTRFRKEKQKILCVFPGQLIFMNIPPRKEKGFRKGRGLTPSYTCRLSLSHTAW
jgi:hypothetical protein